jgi:hypothetical protein
MVGGKPKSLFHMDDDEYVAKIEAEAKREAEEQAQNSEEKIEGVALKQYDRPERKKKNKNESESDGNDAPTDSEQ